MPAGPAAISPGPHSTPPPQRLPHHSPDARRYPYLDVDRNCAGLRTYAEVADRLASGAVPRFDLSQFRRHPDCPHLFEFNPILEVGVWPGRPSVRPIHVSQGVRWA